MFEDFIKQASQDEIVKVANCLCDSGLFEDASFCDALTKLLGDGRRQHYRDTWQLLCSLKDDPQGGRAQNGDLPEEEG